MRKYADPAILMQRRIAIARLLVKRIFSQMRTDSARIGRLKK